MELWESTSILTTELQEESFFLFDDGDDVYPWYKLLQHINNFYLDALRTSFKEKCYEKDPKKVNFDIGLNKEEFVRAISEVFESTKYTSQAISIFNDIDKEEKREISWDQFLNFAERQLRPVTDKKVVLGDPKIIPTPHVKRETIIKIIAIENEKYFCYALISKHGCVGLYDGNMNFLLSYTILISREDIEREDDERRRKNRWITDALYTNDLQMFFVTSSARNLTIYDASNLHHFPIWLILGIPTILNSLAFCHKEKNKTVLFSGSEHGEIITFHFQQPDVTLFRKKRSDRLTLFYWLELQSEKDYVIIQNSGNIHHDGVNFVEYFDDNTLLTCSRDPKKSVMIRSLDNKVSSYIFKMKKGANCCCLSKKLKILVTGSEDGTLRVWNQYMTSTPIDTFNLHRHGIVDVAIIENQKIAFSCSRDGVLILWDLQEIIPLQSLKIKFPAFREMGKVVEWGKNSLCRGPKRAKMETVNQGDDLFFSETEDIWERTNILLTCCNNVAHLDLTFLDGNLRNFFCHVLPPPPLQNSVLIPVNWRVSDDTPEEECDIIECNEKIQKYIDSLSFILDKDFLSEDNLNNDINLKIARLETKKIQMKDAVVQGAPYLALDLPTIERLELSPNLPVPNKKRIKNLVEKTERLLSAASSKSIIFSSPSPTSSSRTKSNRSSVIEFD